jgi:hypothetical protein
MNRISRVYLFPSPPQPLYKLWDCSDEVCSALGSWNGFQCPYRLTDEALNAIVLQSGVNTQKVAVNRILGISMGNDDPFPSIAVKRHSH